MTLKRTLTTTFVAVLLASPAGWAQSLESELQGLLIDHPLLKSARKSAQAADKSRDAAASGYLPRLSISGDTGNEKIVTPDNNTSLTRRRFTTTLEQNLYAGGRTAAGVEIAEIDQAIQSNTLRSTTHDVLLEAITAYVQVARYQLLISIARRNEETTQRQLSLEDQRVERGGGIAVDVLQARARLQLVRERRVFYEQGLRDALAAYQQVFGHPADLPSFQSVGIHEAGLPRTLDEALAQARDQSPRLRDALLQSKKAQRQITVERAGLLPTVDLVGTQGNDKNVDAVSRRKETSLLLRLNWNLFAGMETTNRTDAARLQYEALTEREVAVLNKSDESVRVAWNQLVNGREREALLDSATRISFDVMQNRKRLRDAGKETAINVLDAEVEYYGVLSNKLNAMHDTRIGSYRLLAAMGMLTPQSLGLSGGAFALPVHPLLLEIDKLDAGMATPGLVTPVQTAK